MSQTQAVAVVVEDVQLTVLSDARPLVPATSEDEAPSPDTISQSLPRIDGGKAAWHLLLAAFVFETLLWGFPLSFGVFQEYYSHVTEFQDSAFIGVIGTVASGLAYIAAPVIIPVIRRHERHRRRLIYIGWPVCLLSLVAGSFAKSLGTLILTQGFMYGIGFVTFYYPILSMVNEYWVARRGMAYGFLCSASGLSGAALPFAIQALLERYGYAITLRAMAVGLFLCTAPLIPFLKGRLPESEVSASSRTDWSFLRTTPFWTYSLSNGVMGLGYFFPALYLPSYAVSSGYSATQGALLLAVMSVSQVLGQLSFGWFSDKRVPVDALILASTLMAALAVYACWGLARSFALLVFFSMLYGFFASGYTAIWARIGTRISSEPTAAFTAFGLLNLGKGIGNILTGPIGGAIVQGEVDADLYGASRYRSIVLFTGTCMLASGGIVLLSRMRLLQARS